MPSSLLSSIFIKAEEQYEKRDLLSLSLLTGWVATWHLPRMKSKFLMVVMFLGAAMALVEVQAAEEPKKADEGVKHVNAKEAQKLVAEKRVVVLDVRTPAEFKEGHIAGATNVDFRATDFQQRIGQLDKSKTYLVHCAAGGRSTQSLPILKKQELKTIYHLDGGFNGWKKEGLAIEK